MFAARGLVKGPHAHVCVVRLQMRMFACLPACLPVCFSACLHPKSELSDSDNILDPPMAGKWSVE